MLLELILSSFRFRLFRPGKHETLENVGPEKHKTLPGRVNLPATPVRAEENELISRGATWNEVTRLLVNLMSVIAP